MACLSDFKRQLNAPDRTRPQAFTYSAIAGISVAIGFLLGRFAARAKKQAGPQPPVDLSDECKLVGVHAILE